MSLEKLKRLDPLLRLLFLCGHMYCSLTIVFAADVELEYGSVANVGDMSAFGPLRAPSEAGHYSSNEEGGEEGEGEEGEGEGSSAESSQELRSRNIG